MEARIWASEGVGGWRGCDECVTEIELARALGERSDAGDCADIRLDGAIPGSENGASVNNDEEAQMRTVCRPQFPPLAGLGPV